MAFGTIHHQVGGEGTRLARRPSASRRNPKCSDPDRSSTAIIVYPPSPPSVTDSCTHAWNVGSPNLSMGRRSADPVDAHRYVLEIVMDHPVRQQRSGPCPSPAAGSADGSAQRATQWARPAIIVQRSGQFGGDGAGAGRRHGSPSGAIGRVRPPSAGSQAQSYLWYPQATSSALRLGHNPVGTQAWSRPALRPAAEQS